MRAIFMSAVIAGIAAGVAATAWAAGEGDAEVDWTAKAKEAWSHTCQKCHTVPDRTFETGRAFLSQVKQTS